MFDLIIANPPYGKSGGTAKGVVKTMYPLCSQCLVLGPVGAFADSMEHLQKIKTAGYLKDLFTDTDLPDKVYIGIIEVGKNAPENIETTFAIEALGKKYFTLRNTLIEYNKTHVPVYKSFIRLNGGEHLPEETTFVITHRGAQDKVHEPIIDKKSAAEDVLHNIGGKPIDYSIGLKALTFNTRKEFENFRDWWYKVPGTGKDAQKTLLYCILDMMYKGRGQWLSFSGVGLAQYIQFLPNLDWSRSWTDEEIIDELKKEAGLPEDWTL